MIIMKKIILTFSLLILGVLTLQSQNQKCNCCTEKHSEFDFWIGSWETFTPEGKLAGTNEIDKIQDQCILRENWTSSTPGHYW